MYSTHTSPTSHLSSHPCFSVAAADKGGGDGGVQIGKGRVMMVVMMIT